LHELVELAMRAVKMEKRISHTPMVISRDDMVFSGFAPALAAGMAAA